MKITTLGTSHGDHTYCRFNSSTLFESSSQSILIDAGEPVNGLMIRQGKPFADLKAVFITHMHNDHVGGLPGLIKAAIKYAKPGQHTDIFMPENGVEAIKPWLEAQHLPIETPFISLNKVKPGLIFNNGVFSVTAIGTRHIRSNDEPASYAYLIECEGKKVLYSGDLTSNFSDFPEISKSEDIDLCFCEATHYKPEVALPYLSESKIKRLIFNHVYDTWHGEGEAKFKSYFASMPFPVEIAHDCDEFLL